MLLINFLVLVLRSPIVESSSYTSSPFLTIYLTNFSSFTLCPIFTYSLYYTIHVVVKSIVNFNLRCFWHNMKGTFDSFPFIYYYKLKQQYLRRNIKMLMKILRLLLGGNKRYSSSSHARYSNRHNHYGHRHYKKKSRSFFSSASLSSFFGS